MLTAIRTKLSNHLRKAKPAPFWMVYFISPKNGKKVVLQSYEDRAEAQDHLSEFKKRYGKMIQAGIEETEPAANRSAAVQNFARARSKRLSKAIAKCTEVLKKRK